MNLSKIDIYEECAIEDIQVLNNYFRKRAEIEVAYTKELQKLNRKTIPPNGSTITRIGLNAVRNWTDLSIEIHDQLSVTLLETLPQGLNNLVTSYNEQVMQCRAAIVETQLQWEKNLSDFRKKATKMVYAEKESEDARKKFEKAVESKRPSSSKIRKYREEFSLKALEARTETEKFQAIHNNVKMAHETFYTETLPLAYQKLESCDIDRIDNTKELLLELKRSLQGLFKKAIDNTEKYFAMIQNASGEKETKNFALTNSETDFEIPELELPIPKNGIAPSKSQLPVISKAIEKTERAIAGINVLIDVYKKQPKFCNPETIDELHTQLDELTSTMEMLNLQKKEIECFDGKTSVYSSSIASSEYESSVNWNESEVPMKAITEDSQKLVVLYDFDAEKGSTELSIKQGDKLTLIESHGEWWMVKNSIGEEGFVPYNYVSDIQ